MTEAGSSPNEFEQDKPRTPARDRAEALIEGVRRLGGSFVDVVRSVRLPMALTDPALPGNPIVFANDAFLRLSGYLMDEVLGQQPHFMNGPDTDPRDAARFDQILADDADGVVETIQYAKDGRRFVATVLLSGFTGDDGRTIHHFLSWTDVTGRVDAESENAELRASQAVLAVSDKRLRGVLNAIGEGFAHLSSAFTVLDVNDETLRLDGRSREELIGRSYWEMFPDTEQSRVGELFRQVMRDRTPASVEHRYLRPGAGEAWAEVRAFPTADGGLACFWRDLSSQKIAESALRESEARRQILQTAWETDATGAVVNDSPSWRAFTGQTLEEWLGYGWLDAVHPDDRAYAERQWREAVATLQFVDAEFRLRIPDGGWRWTNARAAPVLDADGKVEKWAGMNIDIESRKRAEAALRESDERLRQFGDASQDLLWIRDIETLQWTYLTPAFETIYGVSREEATKGDNYRNWLEMIVPEDRALAESSLARVRGGESVTFECRIRRPDGSIRWLRDTDFPIPDHSGKIGLFGGIGQDITSLKQAETALSASEERLRLIVENARDYAIFTTDPEGICTDWREGAEAVFGYSREEMLGQSCNILFTPEDREQGAPELERATAAREGKAPDVRWHMRKGDVRVFIDGVSTALRKEDGELIGFLKIGQDVTEQHAAHERQKLLLAELQHRVRNTLGMIRSMVRFTAQGHDNIEDYLSHLTGRLDSLSRTQQLLTRSSNARVDLHELVSDEMTAQAGGRSAYRLEGSSVLLAPKAAEVLSLALHELVTNSVKYGALGDVRNSGTQVDVGWNVTQRDGQDWLELRWREPSPGHPVGDRRGFGTELITQRVPYELRGVASLDIGEHEVSARIAFPLSDGPASLLETGAPSMVAP